MSAGSYHEVTGQPADTIRRAHRAALPRTRVRDVAFVLFCVLLPAAVAGFEWVTHFCAQTFFNPLPSPWHFGLVLIVPAANAVTWWMTGQDGPRRLRWLGLLNGAAVGIGLYYTIIFAPMLPLAMCALVLFGMGVLPMAPLFGLIGAAGCRRRLAAWSAAAQRVERPTERVRPVPGLWAGFAAALAVLVALQVPAALTHYAMSQAASSQPAERRRGIQTLRRFGSRREMLVACRSSPTLFLPHPLIYAATGGEPVSSDQAREVFYRATGMAYQSAPHGDGRGRRSGFGNDWGEEDDWDERSLRGGEQVGGEVPGLSLASSRLDGTVYADVAAAYLEWTMDFRNDTDAPQEARARVALPAGGVASRLTLWIDGEEREAAFGPRARARAAYEQVAVVQSRDPVLVTSAGPDRVQVQCFPVPPHGSMKVRLGITAPLHLAAVPGGAGAAGAVGAPGVRVRESVALPFCSERNFAVPAGAFHAVRVLSAAPIAADDSSLSSSTDPGPAAPAADGRANAADAPFVLRGAVENRRLDGGVFLHADHSVPAATRSPDPFGSACASPATRPDGGAAARASAIVQRVESAADPAPSRLVIVVDASASMGPAIDALCDELPALPPGMPVGVVVASDGVVELTAPAGQPANAALTARRLREVPARGGQDAVPALSRAWDLASASPGAVVLWLHGPQPILLQPVDEDAPWLGRRAGGPALLELAATGGPNRVAEALPESGSRALVPRAGTVREDLHELFTGWATGRGKFRVVRSRRAVAEGEAVPANPAARPLAQLWAADEVRRVLGRQRSAPSGPSGSRSPSGDFPPPLDSDLATPADVAVSHRVVTPATGAVVLETRGQYEAAGLKPPEVQAVPLPPAALLALTAVPAIALARHAERRRAGRRLRA